MNKIILSSFIALLAFCSVESTWAAKFQSIAKMKNSKIEALAQKASGLLNNENAFGDCSSVQRYSFTRKAGEENLNTMKQLNIAKAGIWADDDGESAIAIARDVSSDAIVEDLMLNTNQDEYEDLVDAGRTTMINALNKARKGEVESFSASHGNEDGSWNLVDILDTKNNEVLIVSFGFCGT